MNAGWNIETYLTLAAIAFSTVVLLLIMRNNWKKYGLLSLLSAIAGNFICYIFCKLGLYCYPYELFPIFIMPLPLTLTMFPACVLFGVRYSPKSWAYKIPFYWTYVHLGMLIEGWAENQTQIIKFYAPWDLWTSYTWWWIFLLVFEWVGGMIIPADSRRPIDQELLKYGKIGWFVNHFVLISTIFIAGVYTGFTLLK
jgi:hypothetical protein